MPRVTAADDLIDVASGDRLAPARRDVLTTVLGAAEHDEALAAELANLRTQLGALWEITRL